MSIHYNQRIDYRDISKITTGTGWYNIVIDRACIPVYINQDYDGGGWCLVLANRINTGGMNNLTFTDAIHTANYRTGGSGANTANTVVPPNARTGNALSNYNVWMGLRYWRFLSGRATADKMTIVNFVSPTVGIGLNNTHTKRYRWSSNYFGPSFEFSGVSGLSDETSTGAPGMYSYHAVNSFSITTYDMDRDPYGSNCSTMYNNNPFWYGACWAGNWFAGGGYADAPFWAGSGADYHNYGAVYIK